MRVIGIDEAGYGPMLGPLVVASVSVECDGGYDPGALWRALGPGSGVADSKLVLAHGDMARGEATTLAVLELAGVLDPRPGAATRRGLFERLLVEPPGGPGGAACCVRGAPFVAAACEPDARPLPRWAGGLDPGRASDLGRRLAGAGVRLAGARAIALCPGRLNEAVSRGVSKLVVDWSLFAKLLEADRDALAAAPGALAACGKLGGQSRYGRLLADLGLSTPLEEGRARSRYRLASLGEVEFVAHAESVHPPVAMASMIAKLVRELVLDQWHEALARHAHGLAPCSGYHNAATARFVEATCEARRALGVPDRCFVRDK